MFEMYVNSNVENFALHNNSSLINFNDNLTKEIAENTHNTFDNVQTPYNKVKHTAFDAIKI
jgi:hypothetical protein